MNNSRRFVVLGVLLCCTALVLPLSAQTPPLWNSGTPTCGSAETDCVSGSPIKPSTWPVECGATCGTGSAPSGSWVPYSWGTTYPDSSITDKKPIDDQRVQDPSNGGTTPQNYVNVSSGCPDQTLPSIYYYFDKTGDGGNGIIYFRWRVEQIANNYAIGPSPGTYSSTDPWSSALWTVLLDLDGNGYRDFAMHLNGSSGAPSAPIDLLRTIWSSLTSTNSIDYIGDPTHIHSLFSNPTAFVDSNGQIVEFNGSGAKSAIQWPNGSSETNWDYGTTRSINISTASCGEYYVDYQIPLRMLNAAGVSGPTMHTYSPFQFLFVTANSLNNPFQKDVVWQGNFVCDASSPGPFGDAVTLDGGIIPQPIVTKFNVGSPVSCMVPVSAQIMDALTVNNCQSISQLVNAQFKYYYDINGDGQDDDGGSWINIGNPTTPTGTTVTANWDISSLVQGQYLLALEVSDTRGHKTQTWLSKTTYPLTAPVSTFSCSVAGYSGTTCGLYTNVPPIASIWTPSNFPSSDYTGLVSSGVNSTLGVNYQIVQIGGGCGTQMPTMSKSASVASVSGGTTFSYTLTIKNYSTTEIDVSNITDTLPTGFTYAGSPVYSGFSNSASVAPNVGDTSLTWTFPTGTSIPFASGATPGQATLTFNVKAGSNGGTFFNSAQASTNVGTVTGTDNTGVTVTSSFLTASKQVALASATGTPITTANQGDQVQFQMTVTNPSQNNVTSVTVSDPLPAGFTFVSASSGGTFSSGTVTWTNQSFSSGGGSHFYTINATATQAGTVVNTVTATPPSVQAPPVSASTTLVVSGPVMAINKTANKSEVVADGTQTVDYYIDYSNTGNATANITTLTDSAQTGFTLQTGAPTTSGCTQPGGSGTLVTCTINNTLAAGATANITLRFLVGATATNPSNDTATVNASNASSASANFAETLQVNSCTSVDYHFRNLTNQVSTSSSNLGVTSLTVTAAGTGYTNQPVVVAQCGGYCTTGATATANIVGGVINSFTVNSGGSGYTTTPTVIIQYTGCASQPTATATLSGGVVTGITVTGNGGSGCTAAGAGLASGGFTATAHGNTGNITAIDVNTTGAGFTSTPSIRIVAVGAGTGATATATTTAAALTANLTQGSAATATPDTTVNQVQTEFARFYSDVPTTNGSTANGVPDSLIGYIVSTASVTVGFERISGNKVLSQAVLADFDPATNTTTQIGLATGPANAPNGSGDQFMNETYSITTGSYVLPATHRLVWIISARDSNNAGTSHFKFDYNGNSTTNTTGNFDSKGTVCLIPIRMSVTKEANKLAVTAAGDTIAYTIRYNNPSSVTVNNVKVYDPLPTGLSYSSSSASTGTVAVSTTNCPTVSAANCVVWTINNVAANGSGTLTINANVLSSITGSSFQNTATLTDDYTGNYTSSVTTAVGYPDVRVTKVASGTSFVPGQWLTFTVSAVNAGYGSTNSVVAGDSLPSGLLLINNGVNTASLSGGGSGYTSTPNVVFSGGGGSGAAAVATVTGGVVTAIRLINPGSGYSSAPTFSFSGGGGSGGGGTTTITNYTNAVASIAVTAGGSGYAVAPTVSLSGGGGTGATATATITGGAVTGVIVTNGGSGYTSAPSVTFSSGTASATASLAVASGTINFTIGTLASGATDTFTIPVLVGSSGLTAGQNTITNTATVVDSYNTTPRTATAVITVTANPVLTLSETATPSATRLNFVTVNSGGTYSTPPTITVDQTVCPGATVEVSTSPAAGISSGSYSILGVTVTNGGTCTGTPTLTVNGSCTTCASLTPSTGPGPGDTITYNITLTNTGTADAANCVINGTVPANTTYTSGGTFNLGSVSQNVGTLSGGGGSSTLTYTVTVNSVLPFSYSSPWGVTTLSETGSATSSTTTVTGSPITETFTTGASPRYSISDTPDGDVVADPLTTVSNNIFGSTTIVVGSTSLMNVGDYIAISNGSGYTVAKITGISGSTITVDTPVTASAGTNILPVEEYTLAYSNIGDASGQNVTVTDILPGNLLFGGIVSNGGNTRTDTTAIGSTGTLAWSVGTLSNGGSGTIQFLAFPSTPGVYTNTAVIADGSALNDRNAYDSATTTFGALNPTKTTSTPVVTNTVTGTTASYTITVQNPLTSTAATNVSVIDTLASGFTYKSGSTIINNVAAADPCTTCVGAVKVTSGGSGYTSAPTVIFTPSGATATAIVSSGVVTGIYVTNGGSGYASAPTISFSGGGGGAGATAVALISTAAVPVWSGQSIAANNTLTIAFQANVSSNVVTGTYDNQIDVTGSIPSLTFDYASTTAEDVHVCDPAPAIIAPNACANSSGNIASTVYRPNATYSWSINNGAVITTSTTGTVASITIGNGGSGYTSGATVAITGGGGSGATASATVSGGVVTAITVLNAGTGYTSAPTVTISPVGAGSGATATAVLGPTRTVNSISLVSGGTGYTSAPTVTISAPAAGGTTATATATVSLGAVTAVTITNPGSGYTSTPTVSFGGPGSGASAAAVLGAGIIYTAGSSSPTISLTITEGVCSVSASATPTVSGPVITAQPSDKTFCLASGTTDLTLTVTASGTTGYLWQQSTDSGSTWNTAPNAGLGGSNTGTGGTTASYTFRAGTGAPPSGDMFRVIVSGSSCTVTSNAITITNSCFPDLAITTNSASPTPVYAGQNVTFTQQFTNVAANSTVGGATTYFWEPIPTNTTFVSMAAPSGWACPTTPTGAATTNGITSISITAAGSGYASATAGVTIAPPTSGVTALAVPTVVGGQITAITIIDPGSGYTSTPTVTITGAHTVLATATAATPSSAVRCTTTNTYAAGATSGNFSFVVKVDPSVADSTTISDTVRVTTTNDGASSATLSTAANNVNTTTATVLRRIDMQLGKNDDACANDANTCTFYGEHIVYPGSPAGPVNLDWSITVANGGPSRATGITVTDTLPFGFTESGVGITLVGNNCSYNSSSTTVTCTVATLDPTPFVSFSGGTGGTSATATVTSGAVTSVAVNTGGSGYTSAPEVFITGVGTGATATATVSGGAVTGITVTNGGSGYTSTPSVTFAGGGGSPSAIATVVGNAVTSLTLTSGGSGYTTPPTVTISTFGPGSGATATAVLSGNSVTKFTLGAGGSAYTNTPVITINGQTTVDTTALANTATVTYNETDVYTANDPSTDTVTVLSPSLVKMFKMDATQSKNVANITWSTSFEQDNLGFFIWRQDASGNRTKIAPHIIAGSALLNKGHFTGGRSYRFVDKTAPAGFVQYYIEDVDLKGAHTLHGPVTPRLVSSTAAADVTDPDPTLGSVGGIFTTDPGMGVTPVSPTAADATRLAQQWALAAASNAKVIVTQAGWYRFKKSDLVAAGFDPGTNPNKISVFADGIEIPIVVNSATGKFDVNDTIEFFGTGIDTPGTGGHVYYVTTTKGSGLRYKSSAATGGQNQPAGFNYTFNRTERTMYFVALTNNGDRDNFFGAFVSSDPASETLSSSNIAPGNAVAHIVLQGMTDNFSHVVSVTVNGHELGPIRFSNQSRSVNDISLPTSYLVDGDNLLTFTALGGDDDASLVETASLTYPHAYRAEQNALAMTAPALTAVSVTGFTSSTVRVYDLTDPANPMTVASTLKTETDGTKTVSFTAPGTSGARTLFAVGDDRVLAPAQIVFNQPSTLNAATNGAKMVIVTNKTFLDAANTLANARTAQGIKTIVVDVQNVYDEFSYGVHGPDAIRAFFQRATSSWATKPTYAILFGDSSFDARNYYGMGSYDFVPTKMIASQYLKAASDDWFADFNNTGIPVMAIGRMSARTPDDANGIVAKYIARGTAVPTGTWAGTVEIVNDVANEAPFERGADQIAAAIPAPYNVSRISFARTSTGHDDVINAFNTGSLLTDYTGHGSVEVWSDYVFTSADASALANGPRLPFVVTLNCLNGLFNDLFTDGMAEALLRNPNGGSIGGFSSSALTSPDQQLLVNAELNKQLFNGVAVGDAMLKAKAKTNDMDVRRTWILFGDPTLKLK